MPDLALEGVSKSYGQQMAVQGLDLHVRSGELLVLMGPSGCGKSTTLRLVAGLETPDQGRIRIDGEAVQDRPPAGRGVSLVMQGENLFPHLSVRDNLLLGPRLRGTALDGLKSELRELASDLRIEDWLGRFPGELSGGERQLVAIGRAMMRPKNIVLLDEPLSHLDGGSRRVIRTRLRRLQKKQGLTLVYVTHDQTEAAALADRIAILRKGSIIQIGTPEDLYQQPCHPFVAEWMGDPPMNVFRAAWWDGQLVVGDWRARVDLPLKPGEYWAGIRPEHLRPTDSAPPLCWRARVEAVEHRGDRTVLQCLASIGPLQAVVGPGSGIRDGDQIQLTGCPSDMHFFSRATGERVHPPLRA